MGTILPSEPSAAMLNLSALAYLLGVAIITWCITRATERYSLWTKKAWTSMPWARLCYLLALVDTWLYLIMTGVLLHGAPHQHEQHRCSIGIFVCLICYMVSKVLVYLCLIERVRAVWNTKAKRLRSPIYIFCISLLLPLVGVGAGVIFPQAIHYIRNGYCVIGINQISSLFIVSYDTCINLFLTVMFVAPLMRATIRSAWLRTVAIRSTVATLMALLTSATNGVIIYVLEGNETIWVCLGNCAADLVINAVILFWAFQGPAEVSKSQARSVYFSPMGNTPTFQPGTLGCIVEQDHLATSHNLSHQHNTSGDTIAASHVQPPSLEKPSPVVQSPWHHVLVVQHPSRRRLSLPPATERYLTFREKPESQW